MYSVPARRLCALVAVLGAAVLPLAVAAPAEADTSRTLVGTLLQAYPESAGTAAPADAPLSWVRTDDGEAVRVPTSQVADVPAGATVQVTVGGPVHDPAPTQDTAHAVVDSEVLADPPVAQPQPAAGPTDQVTVVRVVPDGGTEDEVTVDQVVDVVDGAVASFWSEQSNGAIRLAATAGEADWIHTQASCSDPIAMWDEAADASGFTPGPGKHLLAYLSSRSAALPGCSYALASVGSGVGSGGMAYVSATLPSVIAHELGHNFGLGHSSGRQCDGTVDTGTCRTAGYRDYYDVMGASWQQMGTLNAAQEARLGVLPAGQQRTLDATGPGGAVILAPLSGRSGIRALQLTGPDGTDYWLEYRTATGQDAWLADTTANRFGLQAGVLVHRAGDLPDTSLLLDGTPSPAAGWDDDLQDALPVGTPVQLADGFTVTVQSLTATAATLTVTTTPAVTAASPAAPSSASPRPRTLPSHGCDTDCPAGRAAGTGGATGGAATPITPAQGVDHPTAVPVAQAAAGPGRPGGMTLATLHSPTVLSALAGLLLSAVFLGWLLVRRLRAVRAASGRSGR